MQLLEQLAQLVGVESVEVLAKRIGKELAGTGSPSTGSPHELLVTLAHREKALDVADNTLTLGAALTAIGAIDGRVLVMTALVRRLGYSESTALRHDELVRRLYEDTRFVGKEPKGGMAKLIQEIAEHCEPGIGEDDLELFLDGDLPSLFFYETVRAHAEGHSELPGVESEEEEEEEEEEEPKEVDEPVRAYIKPFSVRSLIEMVEEGELDVQPAWQRTDVWSLKKKRELIKSLILGIPLPSIILHSRSRKMSIIDGKQRLLSIVQFVSNEYKLPKYEVPASNPLYACRGAFYDKPGKPSLPQDVRKDFRLREIPALLFEDVPESRLRNIFHLYNVAGMKLNAAEIRNAVYQVNPIHKVCYVLAGEGQGQTDLGIGGLQIQETFKIRLRATYAGASRRYQGVDFLARYLGYSRAAQADPSKSFTHPSTSTAIDNYLDHATEIDSPATVAEEIVEVFDAAERFFDVSDDRLAFYSRGVDGKRKFSKLAATTHMVAARFLLYLIKKGLVSEGEAVNAARAVDIRVPDKQQSATIWDFQARVLIGLRDHFDPGIAEAAGDSWPRFFEKMESCILSPEDARA